ncbi:MAG: hypothetical protein ABR562_00925 [Thermoplasmatota archaeon]
MDRVVGRAKSQAKRPQGTYGALKVEADVVAVRLACAAVLTFSLLSGCVSTGADPAHAMQY